MGNNIILASDCLRPAHFALFWLQNHKTCSRSSEFNFYAVLKLIPSILYINTTISRLIAWSESIHNIRTTLIYILQSILIKWKKRFGNFQTWVLLSDWPINIGYGYYWDWDCSSPIFFVYLFTNLSWCFPSQKDN